jgi:steroid 5-alpha reductase family enzyme
MALLILLVCLGLSVVMAAAWAFQRARGNGGWTDVWWSFATGGAGLALALWPVDGPPSARQGLAAALVAAWSLRLGVHLLRRTLAATSEDPRYARFRQQWGEAFDRRMFSFLQVQAASAALLALAVLVAARRPGPLGWQDAAGVALMVLALAGETLADAQLARFKADPANHGKVCDVGLWGWSRHPNYFFEWLVWLAWPVIAIGLSWPFGWLALIGPAFMALLLIRMSGVPPLEAAMIRSRGEAYRAYQRRVSVFVPLPPRKDSA